MSRRPSTSRTHSVSAGDAARAAPDGAHHAVSDQPTARNSPRQPPVELLQAPTAAQRGRLGAASVLLALWLAALAWLVWHSDSVSKRREKNPAPAAPIDAPAVGAESR